MIPMRDDRILALILLSVVGGPVSPSANGHDQDEIRQLRQTKQILPLDTIIANHRRRYPGGKLLEAELEANRQGYLYELKILGDDGVVREFEYDARSGERLQPESPQKQD